MAWLTVLKNILTRFGADIKNCNISELPEKDNEDPQNRVVIKIENLRFNDIPTLISTVRFELQLNDKQSFHVRLVVKTRKDLPASNYINEYNLLEKRLEDCCKEFDKTKKSLDSK